MLLEDHLYWALVFDRYVCQQARYMQGLLRRADGQPAAKGFFFEPIRRWMVDKMSKQAHEQGQWSAGKQKPVWNLHLNSSFLCTIYLGLSRLGAGKVQKCGIEDLEAISTFLGSKSYVMGGDK